LFKGLSIYKLVFQYYFWKLAREGYPIEFFIEGGRSRTGKLLLFKMGILSMLMEGWRCGEY
jgi:glycerol-3-phosphate O-acyltransferase